MRRRLLVAMGLVLVVIGALVVWNGVRAVPEGLTRRDGTLAVPSAAPAHVANPSLVGPEVTTRTDGSTSHAPAQPKWSLVIPAVGIDAPVAGTLRQRGSEWWPADETVGRLDSSALLDAEAGTTTLAGHVWLVDGPGVLAPLHKVVAGNEVGLVEGTKVERFLVTDVVTVPRDRLPGWVWGSREGRRRLVIVTCAGRAVDAGGHRVWSDNLVVVAKAVDQ